MCYGTKKYKVYIFGAGNEYQKLKGYLYRYKDVLDILGVVTSERKHQIDIDGLPVLSVKDMGHYDFIIISVVKWQEILDILHMYGIDDKKIILGALFYDSKFDFREYIREKERGMFEIEQIDYYRYKQAREEEYLKKAVLTYPPQSITIGVTSACSNKCLFCSYHGNDARENSNVYQIPFMLSYGDFVRIVDMAQDSGVEQIHVCGTGEPFFNPQILQMLDYVIEVHENVSFQTNFNKKLFDKNHFLDEIVARADKINYITTDICSSLAKEHEYVKQGSDYNELLDSLEFIARKSNIKIMAFLILTKSNCKNIKGIIDQFLQRGIKNFQLNIGNLFSYDYSEFTSSDNVYTSEDYDITNILNELVCYGEERGIIVNIPEPADKREKMCSVFWDKFQTWPVKGCEPKRYGENMIPHACAAVVRGDINSLGYLFDYNSLMEAWNSKTLVEIRKNLLEGNYPSEYCKKCYAYHLDDSYYKQKVKQEFN